MVSFKKNQTVESRRMRTFKKSLDFTIIKQQDIFSKNILSGIIRGKVDCDEWKNEWNEKQEVANTNDSLKKS